MAGMQQQLDFIAYIQRMLNEGDFSATYKFALLHAIADVCVEHPLQQPDSELVITLDELVDKFILLYWHHAVPFASGNNGDAALLKQNTGKQSKVISVLYQCQQNDIRNIRQLKQSRYWKEIYRATLATLKDGPLWRLQILSKQAECFLYPHTDNGKLIKLNTGIAYSFRRFYDLVVYLAKNAWLQKIQSIKDNQQLIGPQSQLQQFLFGVDRNALNKARPVLIEIQRGLCFYCNKPLNNNSADVDHFIPFARYSTDLGHNFVATHSACNNSKRDHLAAQQHRDNWQEQNLVLNEQLLSKELGAYFYCDAVKSRAVSDWAYGVAQANGAKLWLSKDEFVYAGTTQPTVTRVAASPINAANDETTSVAGTALTQLRYFPNIKIACGHFKTGDASDVDYLHAPASFGNLNPDKHFLARASGNSMNGSKNPILDGQLLLLELISPTSAGSLQNCTVAIERQDISGDNQYLLRDVKKIADGQYLLMAKNTDYPPLPADENMRTFARLKGIVE
ncbi:HNH endonuclease signature motif containing protein [Rheinheimera hassiensis]|uniref:HNH endonuclease signature motif containing protein n=1 Tax=Rheinheimera hassiensis TaxID=1193627 RepID=UPI001F055A31|nr:HNH endonuclease signature motif containing protein [Rheinheimera hassiensis]